MLARIHAARAVTLPGLVAWIQDDRERHRATCGSHPHLDFSGGAGLERHGPRASEVHSLGPDAGAGFLPNGFEQLSGRGHGQAFPTLHRCAAQCR
ncbi:hypothetical protein DB31_3835 [Hyalangium minutum]|uniref:Uncharacterized protein n=1 Tax=Hyalangium minutum TaxID=394096 RepID=A0A085W4V8_9BACT|nr:hypothetical protein DB31_3835 [Hyalangium minutum]